MGALVVMEGKRMQIALRATALCAALLATLGTQSVAGNWLSDESGLPICRPSGEDRVPIPIWLGSISNTSGRDKPAPPPRRSGKMMAQLVNPGAFR